MHFYRKCLFDLFWGAIYIPFELWPKLICATQMKLVFSPLSVTYCHSLYNTAFSGNVGAWGMRACSLCFSLSDCPSLMLGISIHCIQHSQAILERGVCEFAHSFFIPSADNYEIGKIHWHILKSSSPEPLNNFHPKGTPFYNGI